MRARGLADGFDGEKRINFVTFLRARNARIRPSHLSEAVARLTSEQEGEEGTALSRGFLFFDLFGVKGVASAESGARAICLACDRPVDKARVIPPSVHVHACVSVCVYVRGINDPTRVGQRANRISSSDSCGER